MNKAIVMFSGGLDSVIAVHLLKEQGLDVTALHFVLPFYSGVGRSFHQVETYARDLGVQLRIEEEGEEFLEMIRSPKFGFGKNANPCVDCRIHRLIRAGQIMEEMGAVCLATGEVAGQRPMSQKINCLRKVEKLSGLKGKLLRPLSAKLLEPTDIELSGLVDREKLLDISGRTRAVQLAYAARYGLSHSSPAGGCLLTNIETGARFNDLAFHNPQFSLVDFKLLAYGRHFRMSPRYRVVISRDEEENNVLEKLYRPGMFRISLRDALGPLALGLGEPDEAELRFSASAVVRFSRARNESQAAVAVEKDGNSRIFNVGTASENDLDKYRITSKKSAVSIFNSFL